MRWSQHRATAPSPQGDRISTGAGQPPHPTAAPHVRGQERPSGDRPRALQPPAGHPRRRDRRFVLAALVLVALVLRAPFSSVGPLLDSLQAELHLSALAVSLLPALPLICFGLLSPAAPALAARVGAHRAVLLAVGVLGAGVLCRTLGAVGLFTGTLLIGSGIAIVNVLLPAVVRADFAGRAPAVIGLVTTAMSLSAALGAGAAQPLFDLTGGARSSLLLWALPIGIAALCWAGTVLPGRTEASYGKRPALLPMLRDPTARAVMVFFGLQSLIFYSLLSWLPQILRDDAGQSPARAGALLAIATLVGAPAALAVPRLAARHGSQRAWAAGVSVVTATALAGLLVAPAWAPELWALLFGLGSGAAFPLALTLVLLRTGDSDQTARLSAAAQCAGYLLAATGPLAVGLLYDAAGAWRPSLVLLLVVTACQLVAGLAAGRPRLVAVT